MLHLHQNICQNIGTPPLPSCLSRLKAIIFLMEDPFNKAHTNTNNDIFPLKKTHNNNKVEIWTKSFFFLDKNCIKFCTYFEHKIFTQLYYAQSHFCGPLHSCKLEPHGFWIFVPRPFQNTLIFPCSTSKNVCIRFW